MRPVNMTFDWERSAGAVVQRNRCTHACADVQTVIGGDGQRCADGYLAGADGLVTEAQREVERPGKPSFGVARLRRDLTLPAGSFVARGP
jgi:hypothetical protein